MDLIYPPSCVCCERGLENSSDFLLCLDCQGELAPAGLAQCPRCGASVNPVEQQGSQCSRCHDEKFRFDRVFALARYQGVLRDTVLRMKHASEEPLMMAMGRLLANQFASQIAAVQPEVVVPIPMHWSRRMVRGTNSPELIGEIVARKLGIPFAPRRFAAGAGRANSPSSHDRSGNERFAMHSQSQRDVTSQRLVCSWSTM